MTTVTGTSPLKGRVVGWVIDLILLFAILSLANVAINFGEAIWRDIQNVRQGPVSTTSP